MPVLPMHSLTAQALDAKFANKQRRYESKYSASYLHHPSPPPRLAAPPRPSNPMFEALRAAAAHLNLPEENERHGPSTAASAVSARRRPVRKAALGTAATLALCALAGGSYYAWAVQAANGGQAAVNATLATFAQRFHDFAANQALFRTLSEKVALLRPAPAPAPEAGPAASPAREEMAEGPALRPALQPAQPVAEPAAPAAAMPGRPMPDALTPAPSASPPFSPAPSDAFSPAGVRSPGSPKPAETAASKPEVAEHAKPAPAQAEPPTATVAAPDTARAASAAPVATTQQLASLFALVRQVDLLVRDTQAENERQRTQVVGLVGSLQDKMTDLEHRLVVATQDMRDARDEGAQLRTEIAVLADTLQASSKVMEQRLNLALARSSAGVALEPGEQQAGAASPSPTSADDGKAVAAETTATDSARIVNDYHVQAASFGVAVLSDAGAAPRQAGGRLVTVGDQVPGVGRVTSITPHGTSWIVQTDHGVIQ